MLKFSGTYPSDAFVETVTEITGLHWSRSTLSYLIAFNVINSYEDASKPGALRQRLIFGEAAFKEAVIFMLTRDALPFMSRGKNTKELDKAAGKDTLKYRLAYSARQLLSQVDNLDDEDLETLHAHLNDHNDNNSIDEYLKLNNYLDANVYSKDGTLDEKAVADLRSKFLKVIMCYRFFDTLLDNAPPKNYIKISKSWEFFSTTVLPQAQAPQLHVDSNSMLAGCYWLNHNGKSISEGVATFCNIIGNVELANGKKYSYADVQREELIAYSQLAVRLDTSTHFISHICHQKLLALGIEDVKDLNPEHFSMIAQIVFLTANYMSAKLPDNWKTHK